MVGGWNPPSFGLNPSFTFPRSSAQMGGPSEFYLLHPIHLSFFHYVGSYEHFSHDRHPSVLWCFIKEELFL
jgi:hypothetical protein